MDKGLPDSAYRVSSKSLSGRVIDDLAVGDGVVPEPKSTECGKPAIGGVGCD